MNSILIYYHPSDLYVPMLNNYYYVIEVYFYTLHLQKLLFKNKSVPKKKYVIKYSDLKNYLITRIHLFTVYY